MTFLKVLLSITLFWPVVLILCAVAPIEASIQLQFDYSYDSSGFFASGSTARSTLEAASDFYASILDDDQPF